MKKIKAVILVVLAFFIGCLNVHAVCSGEENNRITSEAANVKVDYEEKIGIMEPGTYSPPDGLTEEEANNYVATYAYFTLTISNLTENLYVVVTNDVTKESKTYNYSDSNNGVVTIDHNDMFAITNYTVKVYSSNKTSCINTLLNTITKTLPKYNDLSESGICEGAENFYLCYKYLAVNTPTFDEFVDLVQKYKDGNIDKDGNEKPEEKIEEKKSFIEENKVAIIVSSIVIVAVGVGVVFVIIKKRGVKHEKN